MTEEEERAYRDASWKIARTYVDLGEVVGYVRASEFLAGFVEHHAVPAERPNSG